MLCKKCNPTRFTLSLPDRGIGLETLCFSAPCPASSPNPKLFGLPQIFVGSFASLGASGSIPRGRVDTNWQYLTNVSYTMGRHSWKTGFEFRLSPAHRKS